MIDVELKVEGQLIDGSEEQTIQEIKDWAAFCSEVTDLAQRYRIDINVVDADIPDYHKLTTGQNSGGEVAE